MKITGAILPATGTENKHSLPGATMEVDEFKEKVAKGEIKLKDMTPREREEFGHLCPLSKKGWD